MKDLGPMLDMLNDRFAELAKAWGEIYEVSGWVALSDGRTLWLEKRSKEWVFVVVDSSENDEEILLRSTASKTRIEAVEKLPLLHGRIQKNRGLTERHLEDALVGVNQLLGACAKLRPIGDANDA